MPRMRQLAESAHIDPDDVAADQYSTHPRVMAVGDAGARAARSELPARVGDLSVRDRSQSRPRSSAPGTAAARHGRCRLR